MTIQGKNGEGIPIHGGNVFETARQLGCAPEDLVDFSASINPLGPPEGLLDVLVQTFKRVQHYPDMTNKALVDALARRFQLDPDQIVVGNGSTELIYILPKAMEVSRVLAVVPTFKEYVKAFALHGCQMNLCVAEAVHDFQPTLHQLGRAMEVFQPQAILVTHPGSPCGSLMPLNVRRFLLEETGHRGVILLVDEVFVDFCEHESFLPALRGHENLVVIRSMTKFYGIPGLRLGYLAASSAWAARLRRHVPPWSVNTLAQAAGVHCLQHEDYRQKTLDVVGAERVRLSEALARIPGFTVFPSAANYLLVRLDPCLGTAAALKEELLVRHRMLIRDCANFDGLTPQDFRVAVRLPHENDRLIEALTQWRRSHDVVGSWSAEGTS
ncbi:threonine-phosphate decarboxylase CobD [Desulfosoma caldarium]|uniref:threonine-phosphate decarboxylase n=1 Tax=Desulfosoma caldarium TaxID=610254 RepID=A0A3N1URB7_9BACT|nr:threonine-phosphate decarboxylase CobD [Desulfosoma caldarium]ROQ89586.1 L-threonine O-3-phosphate decarboxylase [Desulfosoma caldarium]